MKHIKEINVDLAELNHAKEKNFHERLMFIDWWVEYIKNSEDSEWSEQQNKVINPQID